MTINKKQLSTMILEATKNWDFEDTIVDYPWSLLEEADLIHLAKSDLSDEVSMAQDYVKNGGDWDGLADYLLATLHGV